MLHPKQFEVNEAWIAFRLNKAPIRTDEDGDFNCIALMDAASCFIFGTELIPVSAEEPTQLQIRRLLRDAQRQKQQLPKTLFVSRGDVSDLLTREATRQKIDVVPVAENELLIFIGEARQGYEEWLERSRSDA
jgi:hypothetical protein